MLIRQRVEPDFAAMLAIVNDAAHAYRGVIPVDRWHEPYPSETDRHVCCPCQWTMDGGPAAGFDRQLIATDSARASLAQQSDRWIDRRRAPRGDRGGDGARHDERRRNKPQNHRFRRRDTEQQTRHDLPRQHRA